MADCATDPEDSKRAQDNPDGDNSDNPPHSWKCATVMMEVLAREGDGRAGSPPISPVKDCSQRPTHR